MPHITNLLTCPTCGGQLEPLPDTLQMQCVHCGNKVQVATGPLCPRCGHTDQIQKVSSVYEGNTKEWREAQHNTMHQTRTLLGEKLAPPTPPGYPLNPVLLYGFGGFILFTFIGPLCTIPIFLVLPLGLGLVQVLSSLENSLIVASLGCAGLGLLFVAGLGVGLFVWVIPALQRHFARVQADYAKAKAKVDAEEKPRWQRAMERWNNLYYCARDETLFSPGAHQPIPLDKMKAYLFETN